jgi:TIR domain
MKHFFISYSHADSDFVEELISELKSNDLEIWLDHDKLTPGKNWRTGIDEAIAQSLAVIVVMSQTARQSEYVTYEWAYGMGKDIPIIPLLLDKLDKLHPKLEELQHINFTRSRKTATKQLVKTLADLRINYWMTELGNSQAKARIKAIHRLVDLDAVAAVPLLIDLMNNDPSLQSVRPTAADALQVLGTDEALTAVKEWKKDNP